MGTPLDNDERFMMAFLRSDRSTGVNWDRLIAKLLLAAFFVAGFVTKNRPLALTSFCGIMFIDLYEMIRTPRYARSLRSAFKKLDIPVEETAAGDDETFLREFEAQRWPLEKWHHRDQVKLAYLYLQRYPFEEAAARIRAGIKAHNAAHHVPDSSVSGYHETVTQAWLRLVNLVMGEYGPAADAHAFVGQHPELSENQTLRLFYSQQRIMSPEAKLAFVEPDLIPLPSPRPRGPGADEAG